MTTPDEVLQFWFGRSDGERAERARYWFARNAEFDTEIRRRFLFELESARSGAFHHWAQSPRGRLALVVLLDQFSRNLFRNDSHAFTQDASALQLTKEGIEAGEDLALDPVEAAFLYMPLEHSEAVEDQELSVRKFRMLVERASVAERPMIEAFLEYALRHREIIRRFGHFPHRNPLVGRRSTPEEITFLSEPNSSF